MKRLLLAGVTAFALAVPTVAVTAPAEAARNGTPRCATKAELAKVRPGMTVKRVGRIIGNKGKVTSEQKMRINPRFVAIDQTRTYKRCGGGKATVLFDNYSNERDGMRVWRPGSD